MGERVEFWELGIRVSACVHTQACCVPASMCTLGKLRQVKLLGYMYVLPSLPWVAVRRKDDHRTWGARRSVFAGTAVTVWVLPVHQDFLSPATMSNIGRTLWRACRYIMEGHRLSHTSLIHRLQSEERRAGERCSGYRQEGVLYLWSITRYFLFPADRIVLGII